MVKAIYAKQEINSIINKYKILLHKNNIYFSGLYLFGSYAKSKPRIWSDIDIAVISKKFGKNPIKEAVRLDEIADQVSLAIEPHPVNANDFKNNATPLCMEIKNKGIQIS
ncbi:MAG: nucleotidyltransferase domain-containing protein [Candidatus Kuenenbacteria bacterium]